MDIKDLSADKKESLGRSGESVARACYWAGFKCIQDIKTGKMLLQLPDEVIERAFELSAVRNRLNEFVDLLFLDEE